MKKTNTILLFGFVIILIAVNASAYNYEYLDPTYQSLTDITPISSAQAISSIFDNAYNGKPDILCANDISNKGNIYCWGGFSPNPKIYSVYDENFNIKIFISSVSGMPMIPQGVNNNQFDIKFPPEPLFSTVFNGKLYLISKESITTKEGEIYYANVNHDLLDSDDPPYKFHFLKQIKSSSEIQRCDADKNTKKIYCASGSKIMIFDLNTEEIEYRSLFFLKMQLMYAGFNNNKMFFVGREAPEKSKVVTYDVINDKAYVQIIKEQGCNLLDQDYCRLGKFPIFLPFTFGYSRGLQENTIIKNILFIGGNQNDLSSKAVSFSYDDVLFDKTPNCIIQDKSGKDYIYCSGRGWWVGQIIGVDNPPSGSGRFYFPYYTMGTRFGPDSFNIGLRGITSNTIRHIDIEIRNRGGSDITPAVSFDYYADSIKVVHSPTIKGGGTEKLKLKILTYNICNLDGTPKGYSEQFTNMYLGGDPETYPASHMTVSVPGQTETYTLIFECAPETPERGDAYCEDTGEDDPVSDYTIDYFNKGTLSSNINAPYAPTGTDSCIGGSFPKMRLDEYYCDKYFEPHNIDVYCPYGCEDGACCTSDEPCLLRDQCVGGSPDGTVDPGEECDDGNMDNTDSCTNQCKHARCGDGYKQLSNDEECDDGNDNNFDSCTTECTNSECGDGYIKLGLEICDDGNDQSGDDCYMCYPISFTDGSPNDPYCGNSACDIWEVDESQPNLHCRSDCEGHSYGEYCWDGICSPEYKEDVYSCPIDCKTTCGDDYCGYWEYIATSNDVFTSEYYCAEDCTDNVYNNIGWDQPGCEVDGFCDIGENSDSCPDDCHNGNNQCETDKGEDCNNAPYDCACAEGLVCAQVTGTSFKCIPPGPN